MPKIEIYTTATCPYCTRSKMLLQNKGVTWEEIRIDQDRARMREMLERSQRRAVPQIFIDGRHIGGFDDLTLLDASGELDDLLHIAPHETPVHSADHSEDAPT